MPSGHLIAPDRPARRDDVDALPSRLRFLAAGSRTGREILEHDWSRTDLGPIDTWPASLRAILAMMLECPSAMFLAWGPELRSFYNDAYRPIFGERLERALGARFREIWSDLWDDIGPMVDAALSGETVMNRDLPLMMNRHGVPEESWWTFSYSPVRDDEGAIAGMLCVTAETTAQVVAERDRRASADKLEMALSAGDGIGIWDWDVAADRVTSDERFARLYGVDPDKAAAGAPSAEFFRAMHPEDLPEVRQAIAAAMQAGTSFSAEYRLVEPDGSVRWVTAQGRCRLGADGTALRFPGVSFDITARKIAEEAAGRLAAIAAAAPDALVGFSAGTGRINAWNAGAQALFGYSEAEAIGGPVDLLLPPGDRLRPAENATGVFDAAMREGVVRMDSLRRHKDGRLIDVAISAARMTAPDGRVLGVSALFRDITERKAVEAALAASEERFRGIANSIDQMVWSTRPDGFHDYYNDRWYEFTGVPYGSTDGEGWNDMFHPEDREKAWAVWRQSLATGELYQIEYRLRHRSGAWRWVLGRAQPERDPEGRITRWFGTCTDIHERKLAEDRRSFQLALNDRLRAAADPKTATLDAAAMLGSHVGAARAGYGEIDETGEIVRVERDWTRGAEVASLAGQARILDGFGPDIVAELRAGRTLLVEDAASDPRAGPRYAETWDSIGCRALVVVPLVREGRLRAILYLHESRPRRWTQAEIALAEDVAHRTWDALERARAEEAERANARAIRLIADALPVLIAFIDGDLTYRFANAAYEDWFGIPPDQVVGRTVHDLIDEAAYAARRRHFEAALAGSEERFEIDWPLPDGRPRVAEIHYLPRRTADGTVDGFYVFVQDISDRKRVEAMLAHEVVERTRERDRLWQTTNDLMGTAGLDGYLKTVNPAWERLLGWSETELLAKPFFEIIDKADHEATIDVVRRLADGEQVEGFVDHLYQKDGARRTVMWTAAPEGEIFYIVGRDITGQRQAEEQLRQSQKMEAVGQLTGGIAHDFNNLLTGIVGSLDLMQTRIRQGRIDTLERYAKAAMSSANRAAALTHRLLAFARRQPLEQRPVDANSLVTGMEDMLRRTISERIHLEIVTSGGLWPTLCDAHQLENAVLNLAINARDAMPDGGRLIVETCNTHLDRAYARLHREVEPGQYVCICVTDTGTGMPAEVAARAFEPFFTTKPLGMGTGLGLSMIYGFAQQSAGHAKIYSEAGRGTTVKIYLPRYRGEFQTEETGAASGEVPRAERGETVLVVEDEPVVRDLVVEVLRDLGYRALEAEDGLAGLKLLQTRKRIDLLVTDVGLPGLNGRELAEQGRDARPDLKVLFITGYAENAMFGTGALDPGMEMMTKPFPVEALATRIREMIEGR